ncbi:MAG: hypothetical protein IIV19_00300 [Bacteroidaceae bacterium]|nr:hypothetical protein [Bacteroidaceae bacterium]
MEFTYTFYELGYIEYVWYFIYSLYYKFLEYPIMIRICSVVLTLLILAIPISYMMLFIRNQVMLHRKRQLERCREKYAATFREILVDEEELPAELVREKITDCRGKNTSAKFSGSELNLLTQILKEKIQNYNERNLNRHNYQQILAVLNIAGWLEDTIEKSGVAKCMQCFQTAQILDCPLRGSLSARFAYHKNKQLRHVARSTYALTNREEPFRYMEEGAGFVYQDSYGPELHDILLYRRDNNLLMPNFIEWIKLDQPTNKFRLFCIDEIEFFNMEENLDDLYNYMLITTDQMVKGRAIRTLGKMGYTAMKDEICAMFANSAGYMRASILVGLRELGLRGHEIVEFYKNSYKIARREKVAMTALDALYCCGIEGKEAFFELEQAADAKEKMRFEHIKNPITNDRAYER